MVANQASLIISSMMAVLLQVIITAYLNTTAPAHGTAIAQVLLLIQAHGVQQIAPAAKRVLLILMDRHLPLPRILLQLYQHLLMMPSVTLRTLLMLHKLTLLIPIQAQMMLKH